MSLVIKLDPESDHLYRAVCENAVREVVDTIDAEALEVVVMPGFDGIDKENICRLFMREVNRRRLDTKARLLAGEITQDAYEWHQAHADYVEELQGRVTEMLNLCPTLPDKENED